MQPPQFHIQRIDHMDLVAGMCKEPGIANYLDSLVPINQKPETLPLAKRLYQCCLTDWASLHVHFTCFPNFMPTNHWINSFVRVYTRHSAPNLIISLNRLK